MYLLVVTITKNLSQGFFFFGKLNKLTKETLKTHY